MGSRRIVVVAAAAFESEPIVQELRHMVGVDCDALALGIGPIHAAKSVITNRELLRDAEVLFIGTCGQFGPFETVSLIRPSRVVWLPIGERLGVAYTVAGTAPTIDYEPHTPPWLACLPEKVVICAPEISLDPTLPETFDPAQTVENLELYSVLGEICEVARSTAVILAATNQIGPNAHHQWKANFHHAASTTADFVKTRILRSGI